MISIKGNNLIKITSSKKEEIRILCDLDGVIFFWEKAAADILGIDIEDKTIREELKSGKRIEYFVDGGESKMWEILDQKGDKFWEDIEMLPWGKDLYNRLREETNLFCFLSSPSSDPSCASGKIKSLKKHFGEKFNDFLLGKQKHFCANKNSLLIDDSEKNVDKFEEYGGNVFLWPNPFKIIDGDINIEDVLNDLTKEIGNIKNG